MNCRNCHADQTPARYRVVRLKGGRRSARLSTTGKLCRSCAVKIASGLNQELRRAGYYRID